MSTEIKWITGVLIIILILLGVFYFSNKDANDSAPIKIGVMAPLSGFLADYGEEIKRGVLAADTDTSKVEFIFEDTKCENPVALNAFRKLTDVDKAHFIIGPGCGGPQEVVTPLLAEKNVIVIVPSAASRNLFEQSGGYFYNMQYALEDESKFIAEQMYEKGYKNITLIGFLNAFSETHADSFRKNFQGNIVREIWYRNETTDVASELLKIRGVNLDAIFSTDISFFFADGMGELERLGINVPVFSQYAAELPAVRSLVEGVIYSFPADVIEGEGAIFGLSKQVAEFLVPRVVDCDGDTSCVKESIDTSGAFDETGVSRRNLVLKQIKEGVPIFFTR